MRLPRWESILAEQIETAKHLPFEWGQHDCILWAGGCAEAITGRDFIGFIRGQYSTQKQAYRIIKSLAPSLPEAVDLYAPQIAIGRAQRGDVVWNGEAMGVCNGVYSLFIMPDIGLVSIKTMDCLIAWRIE